MYKKGFLHEFILDLLAFELFIWAINFVLFFMVYTLTYEISAEFRLDSEDLVLVAAGSPGSALILQVRWSPLTEYANCIRRFLCFGLTATEVEMQATDKRTEGGLGERDQRAWVLLLFAYTMYGFTLSLISALRDYSVYVILLAYLQLYVFLLRLLWILYSILHVLCTIRRFCTLLHFLHWLLQYLSMYSFLSNFWFLNYLLCYASLL